MPKRTTITVFSPNAKANTLATMPSLSHVYFLLLLLCQCLISVRPIASVPSNYLKLSKDVCSSSTSCKSVQNNNWCNTNIGPDIPRFTLSGATPLSDLGSYAWFDCTNGTSSDVNSTSYASTSVSDGSSSGGGGVTLLGCSVPVVELFTTNFTPSGTLDLLFNSAFSTTITPISYIVGLVLIVAISVGISMLVIATGLCFACARLVAPLIKLPLFFQLGGAEPTEKPANARYALGFEELAGGALGYHPTSVSRVKGGLILLAAIIAGLACAASVFCVAGITKGLEKTVSTDAGIGTAIKGTLRGLEAPLTTLVMSVGDSVLAPVLAGLNITLASGGIDLGALADALSATNASFSLLPDTQLATSLVGAMYTSINVVSAAIATLKIENTAYSISCAKILTDAGAFNASLVNLSMSIAAIQPPLTDALATMILLNQTRSILLYTSSGINNSSSSSASVSDTSSSSQRALLQGLQEDSTNALFFWPLQSDVFTVVGGAFDSHNASYLSGIASASSIPIKVQGGPPVTFPVPDVERLASSLRELFEKTLENIPDFFETSDFLIALDGNATLARLYVSAFNASLTLAGQTLADLSLSLSLPPRLDTLVSSVENATTGLDLTASILAVKSIVSVLNPPPDFAQLSIEIGKVAVLKDVAPAAQIIAQQISALNETLFALPASLTQVYGLLNIFDSTNASSNNIYNTCASGNVTCLLSQIADAQVQLFAANASLRSVNMSDLLDTLVAANSTLSRAKNTIAFTVLEAALSELNTALAADFTQTAATMSALNASLAAAALNLTLVTSLRSIQYVLDDVLNTTAWGILEYDVLKKGYCPFDFSLCSVDSECAGKGSACVFKGSRRCVNNWFPTTTEMVRGWWWNSWAPSVAPTGDSANCTFDSDCQATSRCVGDVSRASRLALILNATAIAGAPNLTALNTSMTNALIATKEADTVGAIASLTSSAATIGSVNADKYVSALLTLTRSVLSVNTSDTNTTLISMGAAVAAVPLEFLNTTFPLLASVITDLKDNQRPLVANLTLLVRVFKGQFRDTASEYVDTLSPASLKLIMDKNGLSGGLTAIAGVIDDITQAFASQQFLLPLLATTFADSVIDSLSPILDPMQSINGFQDTATNGPLYYLGQTFLSLLPNNTLSLIRATDPLASSVFITNDGSLYPNNKWCFTSACFTMLAKDVNEKPPAQWSGE